MVSTLKSACMILSVFLSLGFGSAYRFLLDQANDGHKKTDPINHEAVKNPYGEEVGGGDNSGSGSGSGSFTGYASGIGTGEGYETNGHRSRVGKGVGNWRTRHGSGCGCGVGVGVGVGSGPGGCGHGLGKCEGYDPGSGCAPGCDPCFTTPIPRIPSPPLRIIPPPRQPIPTLPVCPPGSCAGYCDPCNKNGSGNCEPEPYHEGSATGTATVHPETNNIVSEPNPPDLDHSQP